MKTPDTREKWLEQAAAILQKDFSAIGHPIPDDVRYSCSWPSKKAGPSKNGRRIGECFPREWSEDKHAEIFISPCMDDAPTVLATLVHELIHAIDDCQHGHKGPFVKMAKAIGLEGKMTATHAGEELAKRLEQVAAMLGPYPHAKLDFSKAKKQSTRLLKAVCPECDMVIRLTAKYADQLPVCIDCELQFELAN